MAPLWSQHPRYLIFVLFILVATFVLLSPVRPPLPANFGFESDIASRVALSESIYQENVKARGELIKKYGPEPKDIVMFAPPDAFQPYIAWDFFPAVFGCPLDVQRIGRLGEGGKWTCGVSRLVKKPDCVIYSFGIAHESSFEAEMLSRTNHCQIWGYDFSVDKFGPEIADSPSLLSRAHFHPFKIGGNDMPAFGTEPPMYTLSTLMKENGHRHIDLLKVDIEGFEFELFNTLIRTYTKQGLPLPFGQLQIEIHTTGKNFPEYLKWFEMLESAGLRPFWTEPNLLYQNMFRGAADLAEYSFLNIKGDNVFIY